MDWNAHLITGLGDGAGYNIDTVLIDILSHLRIYTSEECSGSFQMEDI
jgi:hypothetical protein